VPRLLLPAAAAIWFVGCSNEPKPVAEKQPQPPAPVKILEFYASPGIVRKGDPVTLCYGVDQATAVRLEPPVEAIVPAANRCIQFSPVATRTYTLIATGAGGSEASQSLAIHVAPRAAHPSRGAPAESRLIETFATSSDEVPAGQPVTLCYVVSAGATVRIEPGNPQLPGGAKNCTVMRPAATTTYTLTASDHGRTDREKLTVQVK
jgi:hypothetical protein